MSGEVIDLITRLTADTKQFEEGIAKAKAEAGSFTTEVTSKFSVAGLAMGAAMVGAFAGFGEMASKDGH